MSRTKPTDTERAALMFECGHCVAGAGQWCWTKAGRPACMHQSRWSQVRKVEELSGLWDEIGSQFDRARAVRDAIGRLRLDIVEWRIKSDAEIVERLDKIRAI